MHMRVLLQRLMDHDKAHRQQFQTELEGFAVRHGLSDWESWYSSYDEETYQTVVDTARADDVVIDLGAGDLRLALRLSARVRRVYAIEVNPLLVAHSLGELGWDLPRNLHVLCANALDVTIPCDVTLGVLLMRHCQHFGTYGDRLVKAGCQRLATNARWKSGVEVIELTHTPSAFEKVREGWYACRCGCVGYVGQGSRADQPPYEVRDCPACRHVSTQPHWGTMPGVQASLSK